MEESLYNSFMEIEIVDKSLMMIFLLEECNFDCSHCVREDEPMNLGYKLSFRQLQSCLSDCRSLESIRWVHFSGGEPTLWTEGKRDLLDLLLEISKSGFTPGFTTNGSSFLDYDQCCNFFKRYVHASATPLRLYLSIDTLHRNFDAKTGRAQSLDNVIKCKEGLPPNKGELLDTRVVVVISKDSKSLLPDEMMRHYEYLGVAFQFTPLVFEGKAKALGHLCPDLSSDKPEDLGAYYRFRPKQTKKKLTETSHSIVLIGDDYYLSEPKWRTVAQLGHLPDAIIDTYSEGDQDAKE